MLGCPVKGLEFPAETLAVLDENGDDRILCEDLLHAIGWLEKCLVSPESLEARGETIRLSEFLEESPEGRELSETTKRILTNLGQKEADAISLQDLADEAALFSDARTNGDGVLPPSAAHTPEAQSAIAAIMETYGGVEDRTGEQGIDHATFTEFTEIAPAYLSWLTETTGEEETILVFAGETAASHELLTQAAPLLDDWFDKCRILQISPEIFEKDCTDTPLQKLSPDETFDYSKPIHPGHEALLRDLHDKVLVPHWNLKKDGALHHAEWQSLKTRLKPFAQWRERNPNPKLDALESSSIEALLTNEVLKEIENLFIQDKVIAQELERMQQLRKLILLKRDILNFAREFVALPGLYDPDQPAVFQAGTLFLAGRKFHLCVDVDDPAQHSKLATEAGIFLAYCEILGSHPDQKRNIVAAVTNGNAQGLAVGRHGLFYDRKGQEWKARVVRIETHAISLREGILAPFQRLGELVASQFEKISAAREKKIHESLEKGVSGPKKKTSTQPAASQASGIGGILAGGGVAFAALSTSFAFVATSLSKLVEKFSDTSNIFQAIGSAAGVMAGVIAGFLLLIILPSLFVVGRKLRQRDLALLLDASGWAVNPRIRLTHALSKRLTEKRKD